PPPPPPPFPYTPLFRSAATPAATSAQKLCPCLIPQACLQIHRKPIRSDDRLRQVASATRPEACCRHRCSTPPVVARRPEDALRGDRKSTRLNSSHVAIS